MGNWNVRTTSTTSPLRYVVGAFCSIAVFVVIYLFSVRTLAGQTMDQLAFDGAEFGRRSVTPFTQQVLDALPVVSVIAGAVITGILTAVRRNVRTLVVAIGAALGAVLTTQLLKGLLLTRPDLGVDGYAGNSLPSGHTTVAAASALAVFLVSSPRTRWLSALAGTAFAVVAGVSTLANGWHRPSDVIAALLVVAVWGCAGGVALTVWRGDDATTMKAPPAAGARIQLKILVPFLVVAVSAFLVTYFRAFGTTPGPLIAYIGGVSAIIAAGFAVALTATRLFSRLP
ncbi:MULTISPECIES: phosphatase PAP2 family protein [Cryobacterium]|uniref:Phosphatase PAP2 family protein n=1 Tax=Cryobacterium mannosilyticum TaxID=1259190 RepID=A0A4R8WHR8_9MICO|nr:MULTISPECIES: phosphatase PAP2 family protein [Cryobacterium]TFB96105.1 phosphatase PAP2 family protein [Cryobacterium sp. HLT2-28]TFC07745.1 phosphatase PAP2 family protein [Cryobacterium mannosilyticum]